MAAFDNAKLRSDLEALNTQVAELSRRVVSLEKTVAAMRAVGEDFWRAEAAMLLVGMTTNSWKFDVREENILFSDLFRTELFGDGSAKRWVGKSGAVGATIAINRAFPLVFSIQFVDFVVPALANTIKLEVDGVPTKWSVQNGNLWSAPIDVRAGYAQVQFRVFADTTLIPEGKDVTFSIAELRIVPKDNVLAASSGQPGG